MSFIQHSETINTPKAFGALIRIPDHMYSQLVEVQEFPKIPALPFSLPPEFWNAATVLAATQILLHQELWS